MWRADFSLFRGLAGRVPWESTLKGGKGVQESWIFFKKKNLKNVEAGCPHAAKWMASWGSVSLEEKNISALKDGADSGGL